MTHASLGSFIQKNSTSIQLAITLATLLAGLFVAYISARLSPLALDIGEVKAQTIKNTDAINTYIPRIIRSETEIDNQKDQLKDIQQTVHTIYNKIAK